MESEALVHAVQRRSPLYDRNDSNYCNRKFVNQLWKDVADEVGIQDPVQAKRKWMALRDYFRKQHKQDAGKATTSTTTCVGDKRKRWYMYDNMQFLLPYMGPDRTSSYNLTDEEDDANIDNTNEPTGYDDDSHSSWPTLESMGSVQGSGEPLHQHPHSQAQDQPPTIIGSKRKRPKFPQERGGGGGDSLDFDMQILEAIKKMSERSAAKAATVLEDADELFLKSIFLQMRNLDPIAKMECQNEMHTTVLKYMKLSQYQRCHSNVPNKNTQCGHYSDHSQHRPHQHSSSSAPCDPDCSGSVDNGVDTKV